MDNNTIRHLDSTIAKAEPTPQMFDVFRLTDSPLLHAQAPRLVGCELQDLGACITLENLRDGFDGSPVVLNPGTGLELAFDPAAVRQGSAS
jgi:hypothetical protein